MKRTLIIFLFVVMLYGVAFYDNPSRYLTSEYKFQVLKYMATSGRDSVFMVSPDTLRMYLLNSGIIDSVSVADSLTALETRTINRSDSLSSALQVIANDSNVVLENRTIVRSDSLSTAITTAYKTAINDSLSQAILVVGSESLEPKIKMATSTIQHMDDGLTLTADSIRTVGILKALRDIEVKNTIGNTITSIDTSGHITTRRITFTDTTQSQIIFQDPRTGLNHGSLFSMHNIGGFDGVEMSNNYHNGTDWYNDYEVKPLCYFINKDNASFEWWTADYGSGAVTNWDMIADIDTLGMGTFDGGLTTYSDIITDDDPANTILGVDAGSAITSGTNNTYIGNEAGQYNYGGTGNSILGARSGESLLTGSSNCLMGYQSMRTGDGSANAIVGYRAGYNCVGNYNSFLGYEAGARSTSGALVQWSTALGYRSGYNMNDGSDYNFFGGDSSGFDITTGAYNILLGHYAGAGYTTQDSMTVIGLGNDPLLVGNNTKAELDRALTVDGWVYGKLLNDYSGQDYFVNMVSDSLLWVASKYNSTHDIVYKYEKCGNNNLFTCDSISLKLNSGKYPLQTVTRATDKLIMNQQGTDYFPGPFAVQTDGATAATWTGGNHNTNGSRTANTESIEIYADDLELTAGNKLWCDNIKIRTHNVLWNGSAYVVDDRNEIIQEYLDFNMSGNTIEYSAQHLIDSTMAIANYYGMQYLHTLTEVDSIYFAHGRSEEWQLADNSLNSGALDTYTEVEKFMLKNDSEDIYIQVWIDNKYGLPSDIATYIDTPASENKIFTASNKVYFQLLDNYSASPEEIIGFRGSYSFSDQSRHTDSKILASDYFMINGRPHFYADVSATVNVEVPREVSNLKVSSCYRDFEIDRITEIPSKYLTITATDTSNVYLQKSPTQGSITIDGYSRHDAIFAKVFNDSGYTFTSADAWETIPFKQVYGGLNSPHFTYNADSTGVVIGEDMIVNPCANIHFAWTGTATSANARLRLVKGTSGGRVYARCGQDVIGLNKTNNPNQTLKVAGTQGYAKQDTIFIQGRVSDTDLIIKPDYEFQNSTSGSMQIFYIGDY
jgi:hypothetical protein